MEWIRNRALQLAGITVLTAVCDMIIPRGGREKYVRPMLGFILVLVLVRPFAEAFPNIAGLSADFNVSQSEAAELKNSLSEHERDEVLSLYKQKLSENIAEELRRNGAEVSGVSVEIEENDDKTFGSITGVVAVLNENNGGNDKNIDSAVKNILEKNFNVPSENIKIIK